MAEGYSIDNRMLVLGDSTAVRISHVSQAKKSELAVNTGFGEETWYYQISYYLHGISHEFIASFPTKEDRDECFEKLTKYMRIL